jgi:cyclin-dependent kinase 9
MWQGVSKLPDYDKFRPRGYRNEIKNRFKGIMSPLAIELLEGLLTLDPAKRLDSGAACDHDFIWEGKPFLEPCEYVGHTRHVTTRG